MKFKTLHLLSIILIDTATAQTDLIFKSGFQFISKLNDTGITWAGEYPGGNNTECTSSTITSPQDCNTGRDVTHNDATDGHAGFSFTKLDATGTPLANQSVDYATTPWACVKDNVTDLVWEVKTPSSDIGGIHNQDNTFQWGGLTAIGLDHPNRQGIYYDPSWNKLVQVTNTESLCGFNNWRVPTIDELDDLVNNGTVNPALDANYFPNSLSARFWSATPLAWVNSIAWIVHFTNGDTITSYRDDYYRVRLVCSLRL